LKISIAHKNIDKYKRENIKILKKDVKRNRGKVYQDKKLRKIFMFIALMLSFLNNKPLRIICYFINELFITNRILY